MPTPTQTGNSRVFLMEGRAGPFTAPSYEGFWRAGGVSWDQGDVTAIRIPSSTKRNAFDTIGKIQGEQGDPEVGVTARFPQDAASVILRLAKSTCDNDMQVHLGKCRNPKDFNAGWIDGKVLVLESARPSTYGTDDLGALDADERGLVNEETTFVGEDYYEILPVTIAQQAAAEIVQEVVDVYVCDSATCGECGLPSDGCSVIFAVTVRAGGSPGQGAEIVATQDGGSTWINREITTFTATDDPSALACVGDNVIIVSNETESLHYAASADILAENEAWNEVTAGFVAGHGPNGIFTAGPSFTWIVGDGGYVYFSDDPTSSVSVQELGSATVENLVAIHGYDSDNIVAVGENNAVIHTVNGGNTWVALTGPAVGVDLTAVWMHTATEWLVGTASGTLYATRNSGVSWSIKAFPGSGAGAVRDIKFSTHAVGWLAHDTATPSGRVLRTINGGYSWYVAPEGNGAIPSNDRINKLAVCEGNANIVYGGGLADNGNDGIFVKVA